MNFENLNWWAILVAAVVAFGVGAVWFGPKTFFPVWWKAMGHDETETPGAGSNMGVVFGLTFAAQLVMSTSVAVVLSYIALANGSVSVLDGLVTGVTLGIGFAAASSLSHRLFAGHGVKVWLIEASGDVVGITVIGVILALWR
jgi:hypothetical protein